jgi:hypothetical protein
MVRSLRPLARSIAALLAADALLASEARLASDGV